MELEKCGGRLEQLFTPLFTTPASRGNARHLATFGKVILYWLSSTRRANFSASVWLINRVSAVVNAVACNPGC
eukprot:COSAG01_NODE_64360_length_276_cov_12.587571_1_plen_72_part_10